MANAFICSCFTDLRDKDVINYLNESEFEDDSGDEYSVDPVAFQSNFSSSSESSDEETAHEELAPPRPPNRPSRGRVQCNRGRSSSRRGSRARGFPPQGRSSSNRDSASSSSTDSQREWEEKDFSPPGPYLLQPNYLPIDSSSYSKLEYFEQYIDDDFIDLMVTKTNQTSILKTGKSIGLTNKECKIFMGITMLMSCVNYPYIRMYWEQKWRIPIVADNMTRDRYFLLRTSVKIVFDPDVSDDEKVRDKVWKVRPIITRILEGCHKMERSQDISIDEMIIPFTGKCGIKQYCPNKPNPEGLKAFVLANPDGIVCDLVIYQGDTTFPEESAAGFGLGESAVINLTKTLVPGHILYFDRYFSSLKLAQELNERGFKCVGTLMKSRIPKPLQEVLPEDKELKKKGRGSNSVYVNSDSSVAVTKWFDNKAVVLMSTIYASNPEDECRRWCKKEKRFVMVKRPMVVKLYNSKMGGVDLADRMLAVCPSRARTTKWTVRFIAHMFDLATSNAWIQYRKTERERGVPLKKIQSLRQWKMDLAELIIDKNSLESAEVIEDEEEIHSRKRGRPGINPLPSKTRRLHGAIHMPTFETVVNRCRLPGCDKRTTAKCTYCGVALCLMSSRNCFKDFHEQDI